MSDSMHPATQLQILREIGFNRANRIDVYLPPRLVHDFVLQESILAVFGEPSSDYDQRNGVLSIWVEDDWTPDDPAVA